MPQVYLNRPEDVEVRSSREILVFTFIHICLYFLFLTYFSICRRGGGRFNRTAVTEQRALSWRLLPSSWVQWVTAAGGVARQQAACPRSSLQIHDTDYRYLLPSKFLEHSFSRSVVTRRLFLRKVTDHLRHLAPRLWKKRSKPLHHHTVFMACRKTKPTFYSLFPFHFSPLFFLCLSVFFCFLPLFPSWYPFGIPDSIR